MLEIYNEQVRDLLNPKTMGVKGGLKVRQDPKKGFYGNFIMMIFMQFTDSKKNRVLLSTIHVYTHVINMIIFSTLYNVHCV